MLSFLKKKLPLSQTLAKQTQKGTSLFPSNKYPKGSLVNISSFYFAEDIEKWRNIGISAHIDSGKTTFTERVLFYSGKIDEIHEVKGSDGVGATMDFMELEREKGITIQSAATHLTWKDHTINLIDTPGHVDFTIEVERALRVLDGAVLIVCGVSGVQAQTYTVFKQMERYQVPRIIFINKLDRMGANAYQALDGIKKKLGINAELIMLPIGEDSEFVGVVDLIYEKAIYFEGPSGQTLTVKPIPENMIKLAKERRQLMVEKVCEVDEVLMDKFINEEPISPEELKTSIRRLTIERKFSPVFVGSAYKNKGVQLALDGVLDYLPNPTEVENKAFQKRRDPETNELVEMEINLSNREDDQFVCLAFKLDENKYGQLTFCRAYQGKLKRGDVIYNVRESKKVKVSRLVRMHANKMEEIAETQAGDIFAIFGLECSSGTTFIKDEKEGSISLSSMHVPDPVMSVSVKLKNRAQNDRLQKALKKFAREDPTFTYTIEAESEELVISGMGELHLQIYAERLKREYEVDIELGAPTVNYRETVTSKIKYHYLHKKQTGGAGQYARISGYMEPIFDVQNQEQNQEGEKKRSDIFVNEFKNKIIGTAVPNEYIVAVERQFYDSCNKGPLTGYPIINSRFVLEDGETHVVDSSGNAFATAVKYALTQIFQNPAATLLEPIMKVEITVPAETYQPVMNSITKRKGTIYNTEIKSEFFIMEANVPLAQMFGFASELRGFTQGQGEFSMEYLTHEAVPQGEIAEIVKKVKANRR
jgi:elongation factor G